MVGSGLLAVAAGCGGGDRGGPAATAPPAAVTASITLSLSGLRALDAATEGRYEAWVVDRAGRTISAGTFVLPADGRVTLASPAADVASILVTLEPPGDADPAPSAQRVLQGVVRGGTAELSTTDALTRGGLALEVRPGQFTMFSPSDNAVHGYPSNEESGVWLFNMRPRDTPQGDMWVRLTPLADGWVYEGWMVRDRGSPQAIWLSYGKFLPDWSGAVNTRDDTGWGPYSGVVSFRTDGEEEFPGDDWIANPLGFPLPSGLTLPLDLRERTATGQSRWTHVITIEPASDRGEPIGSERPSGIQPYADPFGDGGPGVARTITFRADAVPRGTATLR